MLHQLVPLLDIFKLVRILNVFSLIFGTVALSRNHGLFKFGAALLECSVWSGLKFNIVSVVFFFG